MYVVYIEGAGSIWLNYRLTHIFGFIVLAVASIFLSSCHRIASAPLSIIQMGDAKAGNQLIAGFYGVEGHSWRWTARRFAVMLPAPTGSDTKGAKLELHLYIPETQILKLGPLTLSADVDQHSVTPETYPSAGQFSFTRDIPPEALGSNLIPVVFSFDKAVAPLGAETRELGVVVTMAALLPR